MRDQEQPTSESPSFGGWLRQRRRALDFTQDALARLTGCAPVTIRKLEADELRPSKQLAGLLAEQLGIAAAERDQFVKFARAESKTAPSPQPPSGTTNFPPPQPIQSALNNLPLQLTTFIGREREIAEVQHWLSVARLVTLTGAGGCGKTRLALAMAAQLAGAETPAAQDFVDGIWFVELAPLHDPALVAHTVAIVFGLREAVARSPLDMLRDYLWDKHLLLILDNCEHVLDGCAAVADTVLRTCPEVRVLATSREALGIGGEVAWSVPSLTLPTHAGALTPAQAMHSEAVRLFAERATAVQRHFRLTESNAPLVAQICQRLDGMPLAIELAAVRVKALSVEQIAARLDDRFRLLTGGSRTALPRQQTLRAAIDWSYALLSEPERIVLRRLSIFAGGWTLEAAEQVTTDDERPAMDESSSRPSSVVIRPDHIFDLLAKLVDKSLLMSGLPEGNSRYTMLETIRQYAHEKLAASGEVEALRMRHLEYSARFAEQAEVQLRGPAQFEWADRLDADNDNLRLALDWSIGAKRATHGLRLATGLIRFWQMRGNIIEGRARLERLLAQPEAAARTLLRARALWLAARINYYDRAAHNRYLEEAVAIARDHPQEGQAVLAGALWMLGLSWDAPDPERARAMRDEAWALAQALGEPWALAQMLREKALWLQIIQKDPASALEAFAESLRLFRAVGDRSNAAEILFEIGRALFHAMQRTAEAREHLTQSLPSFREAKAPYHLALNLLVLGELERFAGHAAESQRYLVEGLARARQLGDKRLTYRALNNLGHAALGTGASRQALARFREALRLNQADDGQENARLRMVIDLISFASLAAAQAQAGQSAQLFGAAERHMTPFVKFNIGWGPADNAAYDHYLACAREGLDAAAFEAAWQAGGRMTLEEAIAEAELITVTGSPSGTTPRGPDDLSPREREVLALVAQGLSDAQVAEQLVVGRRTVNAHLTSIYRKLDVNSRSAATRYALEHKLV